MKFILTPESVIVTMDGEIITVSKDAPQYEGLVAAIEANDETQILAVLDTRVKLTNLVGKFGGVSVYGGHVTYEDSPLTTYITDRILAAKDKGPFANFLDNLMNNPSRRAVQDLFKWCEHAKLPITDDGFIVAFKYVADNFMDRRTGTFDNHPGMVCEMPRWEVNDDPTISCAEGLHVCAPSYIKSDQNGRLLVLVKVNPADVVAFPTNYDGAKARVCRYEVMAEIDWNDRDSFIAADGTYLAPWVPREGEVVLVGGEPHEVDDVSNGIATIGDCTVSIIELEPYPFAEGDEVLIKVLATGQYYKLNGVTDDVTQAHWFPRDEALVQLQTRSGLITEKVQKRFTIQNAAGLYYLATGKGTSEDPTLAYAFTEEDLGRYEGFAITVTEIAKPS